jgi:hypothetical protein
MSTLIDLVFSADETKDLCQVISPVVHLQSGICPVERIWSAIHLTTLLIMVCQ